MLFLRNITNKAYLFWKMSRKTYEEKMNEYLDRLLPTIYEVIDETDDESMYDSDGSDGSSDLYD